MRPTLLVPVPVNIYAKVRVSSLHLGLHILTTILLLLQACRSPDHKQNHRNVGRKASDSIQVLIPHVGIPVLPVED